ncbi:MAG: alpha-L-fucosidase [Treponema sp.]|nr:alpha-L-fucosidase [Treponema sp.]
MEKFSQRKMPDNEERIKWFREAKFGMFIHWGVYAQLAGSWQGREIPGIGEQIMRFAKISVSDYKKIPALFNPVKFDADKWAGIAKEAGMRYIVITAKHHDGFAMFHSGCSPYNIVDATPFKRDPMKELAQACQKHGLKLCFYYSHKQDWEDPDGYTNQEHWDQSMPRIADQVFERYMDRKAIPQVTELLTGYGPIGLIWYDTPGDLSDYNAMRFANLVHAIQPDCIVSARVSNNPKIGDYIGYGDNLVPVQANTAPWETCATMNDTWGFKAQDHNWKTPDRLIRLLSSIVSKGGNYLLNVGPDCLGEIPQQSAERLRIIGKWLEKNGDAIYTVKGCLMRQTPEWGAVTGREGKLYIHIHEWKSGAFIFSGLANKVTAARLLATGAALDFSQVKSNETGLDILTIDLPAQAPDSSVSIIELDIAGAPVINEIPNDSAGPVILPGFSAYIKGGPQAPLLKIGSTGIPENWRSTDDYMGWETAITKAGVFDADLYTFTERHPDRTPDHWEGGHRLCLQAADNRLEFSVTEGERSYPRDNYQWQLIHTPIGKINFIKSGIYRIELKALKLNFEKGLGPKVHTIVLRPV